MLDFVKTTQKLREPLKEGMRFIKDAHQEILEGVAGKRLASLGFSADVEIDGYTMQKEGDPSTVSFAPLTNDSKLQLIYSRNECNAASATIASMYSEIFPPVGRPLRFSDDGGDFFLWYRYLHNGIHFLPHSPKVDDAVVAETRRGSNGERFIELGRAGNLDPCRAGQLVTLFTAFDGFAADFSLNRDKLKFVQGDCLQINMYPGLPTCIRMVERVIGRWVSEKSKTVVAERFLTKATTADFEVLRMSMREALGPGASVAALA
jgi:hypothetical protein